MQKNECFLQRREIHFQAEQKKCFSVVTEQQRRKMGDDYKTKKIGSCKATESFGKNIREKY